MRRTDPARFYIRAFYEKNHLRLAASIVLRILMIPGMLVLSWLLGAVVDVIDTGELTRLWRLLFITAGFILYMVLVEVSFCRLQSSFIHRGLRQYKALAFKKLSAKSISAFSNENTGRYISVLTNDVNTVEENYLTNLYELIAQPLVFFATLAFMLSYSSVLTLAAALLCLLPFAGVLLFSPEFSRREKAVSDQNEGFVSKLRDLLSGFAVIKSFKAERETQKVFNTENSGLETTKFRRRWWQGLMHSATEATGILMQLGIFFIGAYLAIRGHITAGTVLIFVNLTSSLIQPVQAIPQYIAQRKAARGLIGKLAGITAENAARTGEAIEPVLQDAIELKKVTFGYEPEKPVLKNLSMRLEAGKKYALVGASGSGKSTLLNLLMGAYENYDGSVAVDGRELRDVDPDSLYDLMSLIGQSVFLFDDTIRQNVTMFRDFPAELVNAAVERSGLSELITERGEDYRCGENGVGLSGGERQRVSIARALLRGTPVLLLDEATAALDNETGLMVTDAILKLRGLTRLVVTHRLEPALMEQYDEIFVLRDGTITERGAFHELMEEKGVLYSMVRIAKG